MLFNHIIFLYLPLFDCPLGSVKLPLELIDLLIDVVHLDSHGEDDDETGE